jgi:hypothetical protein
LLQQQLDKLAKKSLKKSGGKNAKKKGKSVTSRRKSQFAKSNIGSKLGSVSMGL